MSSLAGDMGVDVLGGAIGDFLSNVGGAASKAGGWCASGGLKFLGGVGTFLSVFLVPEELNSSEQEWIDEMLVRQRMIEMLKKGIVKTNPMISEEELEKQAKMIFNEIVHNESYLSYNPYAETINQLKSMATSTNEPNDHIAKTVIGNNIKPKSIDKPQALPEQKPIDMPKSLPKQKPIDDLKIKHPQLQKKDVIKVGEKPPEPIKTGTMYGGQKAKVNTKPQADGKEKVSDKSKNGHVEKKDAKENVESTKGAGKSGDISNMSPEEINKLTPDQLKDALPDGWTYSGSPDGKFIHIKDANGNYRVRIDPPDKVTNYPHTHVFDADGNALDINGNIVPANSPDAHIPR